MEHEIHQPVMKQEVIEGLAIVPNGIYIDGTFGRGGHSRAILEQLNESGRLIAIDKDPEAIESAKKQLSADPRFSIEQGSFGKILEIAKRQGIVGKVNGILLDLGVSSPQLDDETRGFSFLKDGPLDMRMDTTTGVTAAEWLNTAKQSEIEAVLKEYGEERFSRRIAAAIVRERVNNPLKTTGQLAEIVSAANPAWERHKHPATRSFQGIRIFINSELTDLQNCLEQCLQVLNINGRLAVISFHSLEDRIVKKFIKKHAHGDGVPAHVPIPYAKIEHQLRSIKKAIKPSQEELEKNIRARSAVLRITERI